VCERSSIRLLFLVVIGFGALGVYFSIGSQGLGIALAIGTFLGLAALLFGVEKLAKRGAECVGFIDKPTLQTATEAAITPFSARWKMLDHDWGCASFHAPGVFSTCAEPEVVFRIVDAVGLPSGRCFLCQVDGKSGKPVPLLTSKRVIDQVEAQHGSFLRPGYGFFGSEYVPESWWTSSKDLPCNADLSGNGTVEVADVNLVIAGWGTASGDVTGDDLTTMNDLLLVLMSWGDCA
jgi:hypothetical protein